MSCPSRIHAQDGPSLGYTPEAYFKGTPSGVGYYFGGSVAISGNRAVVGAKFFESNTGSVSVFERSKALAPWKFVTQIRPEVTRTNEQFGFTVGISGDTIVVGAPYEDTTREGTNASANQFHDSGAAFVFVLEGETWVQQAHLKASNAAAHDWFGTSVAIDGDRIAVGSPREGGRGEFGPNDGNDPVPLSGAAFVFERMGKTWIQSALLKADEPGVDARLGSAIDLDGDVLVVGAYKASGDIEGATEEEVHNFGAAYIFENRDGQWAQQATLQPANLKRHDQFGNSVALSGDTAVIGVHWEDGVGRNSGAAYVYVREQESGDWVEQAYLRASNAQANDYFGTSVAISGDDILVGAPGEDWIFPVPQNSSQPTSTGAAYVFSRVAGEWGEVDYITAPFPDPDDFFGSAVAISGGALLIGAHGEDSDATGVDGDQLNNDLSRSGASFAFERSGDHLRPLTVHITSTGERRLVLPAVPGRLVGVEFSPDLTPGSWVELGNFTRNEGNNQFTDPDPERESGRGFYRAFFRKPDQ